MKKKIFKIILISLIAGAVWYFTKPYDYIVRMKLKTYPEVVIQGAKLWTSQLENNQGAKKTTPLEYTSKFSDSLYTYHLAWKSYMINDSITQLKVYISSNKYQFIERVKILFGAGDFKKECVSRLKKYHNMMIEHLNSIKVHVEGEAMSPNKFYAYIPVKTTTLGKANGMMLNYNHISTFIVKNNLKPDGNPFLKIQKWDEQQDSLHYEFCFPIKKNENIPWSHPIIKFDSVKAQKSWKAVYNGNYLTSDRAWFALMHTAKKKNIKLKKTPLEVFFNNPHMGSGEENWRTEVYMPIADE